MFKKFSELINEKKHSYGCLMAELAFSDTNWMTDVLLKIDEQDLYIVADGYGRETEPHVTVLYGFHADEINDNDIINDARSMSCNYVLNLQKISLFENADFDVVKFDISSEDLAIANEYFKESYPHTSNFPDYHAHCTIAYVKKGKGKKYVETLEKPIYATVTNFIYSKPDGTQIRIVK